MLLVKNISIEEVVGDWTLKSKDFESSALRIHYSIVWDGWAAANFSSKQHRCTRFFWTIFICHLTDNCLNNRENTTMNKKGWSLELTCLDFNTPSRSHQDSRVHSSRQKNNLWFSLQSVRIRRFWPSSLCLSQGLEIQIGMCKFRNQNEATSVSQKSPQ